MPPRRQEGPPTSTEEFPRRGGHVFPDADLLHQDADRPGRRAGGYPATHSQTMRSVDVKRVRVLDSTIREDEQTPGDLLTPGDLFGALRILGQTVYPETAWALTTIRVLRIDPQCFREILAEQPQVVLPGTR